MNSRGFTAFWLLAVVLGLAFWGVVVYVGVHFIGKGW